MTPPRAMILAGGQGARLGGVRKADLRIGGVRQIDRMIAALGEVTRPILVASGSNGNAIALPSDCVAVPDLESPCVGPLAGLIAVVARLAENGVTAGLLVSAAVDTPFLPANFVTRMLEELGDAPAAYARWGESYYPPNAIWRLEGLQDLPGEMDSPNGPASLKTLQIRLGASPVDWTLIATADPFANINTLADLATLQRLPTQ